VEADWPALIKRADARALQSIEARIHVGPAGSGGSQAQRFTCADGRDYAVKDPNNPQDLRVLFNDQVGARVARLVGAPVPAARVVDVPAAVAATITFSNGKVAAGGACHGSQWIERDVRSAPNGATHTTPTENAPRYAALGVLFTLIHNTDRQFLYATTTPRVVYSVDHGHSFGGSPSWTASSLSSAAVPGTIDWVSGVAPTPGDVRPILRRLRGVSPSRLATVVGGVPMTWGVSDDERVAVLDYLCGRITAVVALLQGMIGGASGH
jgi:hypothetical protein